MFERRHAWDMYGEKGCEATEYDCSGWLEFDVVRCAVIHRGCDARELGKNWEVQTRADPMVT